MREVELMLAPQCGVQYNTPGLLTLAAKHRRRGYCNRLAVFVRPSVRLSVRLSIHCNPPMLNGKGRLRDSTHSRYTRTQRNSGHWYSSEQLLPICVYMALTSAT